MLQHCSGNLAAESCSSEITVLERQREIIKCQQQQRYFNATIFSSPSSSSSSLQQVENSQGSSLAHLVPFQIPTLDATSSISRTFSSPPKLTDSSIVNNKRKSENPHHIPKLKVVAENYNKEKKIRVDSEDGAQKNNNNKENCVAENTSNSKENSKVSDVQKTDYIHVRARRGQATDSHSLAERVRREKISERMKYLQDLVPGCNKISGKAGMLDEIINYVQSLQKQVEFLSMKLATVNPRLDFNIDDLFEKEVFPTRDANATFSAMGMSSELNDNNPYLQFNSPHQFVSYGGLDTGMIPSDLGLKSSISTPVSIPETFIDSSCFSQNLPPSTTWEGEFQNLYNLSIDQARATSFPSAQSQFFTGLIEASNLKIEM